MKKSILLLSFILLSFICYSQKISLVGNNLERVLQACDLIKIHAPQVHEAMVIHSTIISAQYKEIEFLSTCTIDENGYWIIIGPGSLTKRSINRLAGTIFHESLHMLLEMQRNRDGDFRPIWELSKIELKQEELFIYKKTMELLVILNTSSWELQEYETWTSAHY